MKRRVLNLLTALSLLLCAAACGMWVRSYWVADVVKLGGERLYQAASGGGGVFLESMALCRRVGNWQTGTNPATGRLGTFTETRQRYRGSTAAAVWGPAGSWEHRSYPYADRRTFERRSWTRVGHSALPRSVPVTFNAGSWYDNSTYHAVETWLVGRAVWLPYWLLASAASLAPLVWLRNTLARRQRARRSQNLCPSCGYDLRAMPGRCPECGAAPTDGPFRP